MARAHPDIWERHRNGSLHWFLLMDKLCQMITDMRGGTHMSFWDDDEDLVAHIIFRRIFEDEV